MKEKNNENIKIIPIGGLGAIGKNMTLFEYKNEIIIVDCGIMFPTDEMPGIDFIIPDFSYVRKNKKKIKAVVITHGHEDHIGAIAFLLKEINVPIYGTKLTIGLIQSRLSERPPAFEPTFNEIKPRDKRKISNFEIEFIRVNHSISDGVALAITTKLGTIIHTGDFKIDFSPVDGEVTDIYKFADYGEKGVLLLMSDSTNAEKEGFTKSESILSNKIIDLFSSAKGRIVVASFASNINRIQQVIDIAQKFHRKVVISGYSMLKNVEISRTLGYLNIKDEILISFDEAKLLPDKKIVVIGTGSQGEPMSALSRMANGTHRQVVSKKGDTVIITASVIPGNEKTVSNIVNLLMKMGVDVFYDKSEEIHVSGHGSAKELKLMLSITKPKFFMPVHGEYKHQKAHAKIAESLKIKQSRIIIAQNGDILELTQKSFKKINALELSQIYVDGTETGDVGSSIIRDRHTMSTDGVIMVTIVLSNGFLSVKPEIITRGFAEESNNKIIKLFEKEINEKTTQWLQEQTSAKVITSRLRRNLKSLLFKLTRRNSLIIVQVLEA